MAAGDINGDGCNDRRGRHAHTNGLLFHYGQNCTKPAPRVLTDLNGDGKSDLLWRKGSDTAYWLMSGLDVIGSGWGGSAGEVLQDRGRRSTTTATATSTGLVQWQPA
jgi:hypothetical protein